MTQNPSKGNQILPPKEQAHIFKVLQQRKENELCADCNAKLPCWTSLSFGVFICYDCTNAHRQLTCKYTRVQSTTLDSWTKEKIAIFEAVGNEIANSYWEGNIIRDEKKQKLVKINSNSSPKERTRFVHDKYVLKLYATRAFALDENYQRLIFTQNPCEVFLNDREQFKQIVQRKKDNDKNCNINTMKQETNSKTSNLSSDNFNQFKQQDVKGSIKKTNFFIQKQLQKNKEKVAKQQSLKDESLEDIQNVQQKQQQQAVKQQQQQNDEVNLLDQIDLGDNKQDNTKIQYNYFSLYQQQLGQTKIEEVKEKQNVSVNQNIQIPNSKQNDIIMRLYQQNSQSNNQSNYFTPYQYPIQNINKQQNKKYQALEEYGQFGLSYQMLMEPDLKIQKQERAFQFL